MVAAWRQASGIALSLHDLLALQQAAAHRVRQRPAAHRSGVIPSRKSGSGMDLREIRAFVPGDDLRRMDPSATARTGKPHIRALYEDRDDITLLIADFRAPMLWGTGQALRSVRAAHHLANAGWQAVARHGAVGLVAVDAQGTHTSLPGGGDRHMATLCCVLAERHNAALSDAQQDSAPLTQALALAAGTTPAGARVILATAPDGWQDAQPAMARLARGRQFDVVLIVDPLEVRPPDRPMPVVHDGTPVMARMEPPDLEAMMAQISALGAVAHRLDP